MHTNLDNICIERHLWQGKPIDKLIHLLTLNHSIMHRQYNNNSYNCLYLKYSGFKISTKLATAKIVLPITETFNVSVEIFVTEIISERAVSNHTMP